MNIFALSLNPVEAARWHVDKHVVKMPLEYAQLLSTAHWVIDREQVGYKPTHINHPSSRWARHSKSTYLWLYDLFVAIGDEYTYRYGATHKSLLDLREVLSQAPKKIPPNDFCLPFPAMPSKFIDEDSAILSYRNYYNYGKRDLHSWRKRPKPEWIISQ